MTTINFREGTAAQWVFDNPVLIDGEPGFERDTGKYKIGRGSLAWLDLPYSGTSVEEIQDLVSGMLEQGTGVSIVYNDETGKIQISSTVVADNESIQDMLSTFFEQGEGVTLTYDDATNKLTISAAGSSVTQYTDEMAQDAVATMLAAGTHSGITEVYDDAGNRVSFAVTHQVLLLANGASVPGGTPVGTIIFEKG